MVEAVAVWAFALGPAALAAWLIVKFPGLVPASNRGVGACLAAAMTVAFITPQVFGLVAAAEGQAVARVTVVLPAGVCVMFGVLSGALATVRALGSPTR